MKAYILKGEDVDKVIRENRVRINRGRLIVTPVAETELDPCCIETLKEDLDCKTKALCEQVAAHMKLTELTSGILAVVVANGVVLPADITEALAEFGLTIPPVDDAEGESDIKAETDTQADAMDDKNVINEDLQEVDIDKDDKAIEISDSKESPATDVKKNDRQKKNLKN